MSNNPNQIIFKVRMLGILSAIFVIIALLFIIIFLIFNQKYKQTSKSIDIYKALKNKSLNTQYLQTHNVLVIPNTQLIKKIQDKKDYLLNRKIFRESFYSGNIQIYLYEDYYYYSFNINDKLLWYKNEIESSQNVFIVSSLIFLMGLGLIMLQRTITKALKGIYDLQDSKELFMRNIMHEFKTPLTRATFHIHTLDDSLEQKQVLLNQCSIITEYLDKLKQIDQLSSTVLHKKKYALINVVDDIQEHLQTENITHNIDTQVLNIDYEHFFIILKNLLDNGLKYSTDAHVYLKYRNEKLFIYNNAHKLEKPFVNYIEAFQRGDSNSTSGMGLGLYISHKLLLQHNILMKNYQIGGIFYLVLDLKKVL